MGKKKGPDMMEQAKPLFQAAATMKQMSEFAEKIEIGMEKLKQGSETMKDMEIPNHQDLADECKERLQRIIPVCELVRKTCSNVLADWKNYEDLNQKMKESGVISKEQINELIAVLHQAVAHCEEFAAAFGDFEGNMKELLGHLGRLEAAIEKEMEKIPDKVKEEFWNGVGNGVAGFGAGLAEAGVRIFTLGFINPDFHSAEFFKAAKDNFDKIGKLWKLSARLKDKISELQHSIFELNESYSSLTSDLKLTDDVIAALEFSISTANLMMQQRQQLEETQMQMAIKDEQYQQRIKELEEKVKQLQASES